MDEYRYRSLNVQIFDYRRRLSLSRALLDDSDQSQVRSFQRSSLGVSGGLPGTAQTLHQESLSRLMQRSNSRRLEPEGGVNVGGDLLDEPLEGHFGYEQVGRPLETTDVPEDTSVLSRAFPPLTSPLPPPSNYVWLKGWHSSQL